MGGRTKKKKQETNSCRKMEEGTRYSKKELAKRGTCVWGVHDRGNSTKIEKKLGVRQTTPPREAKKDK